MKSYFARIALFSLIFLSLFTTQITAQPDTLSLLHVTDLHTIFNLDIYQQDMAKSRGHYGQGVEPARQFLQTMPRKTNSDMVIVTGDLVDFFKGETPDGGMLGFQVEQFNRVADDCTVPLWLTLGNHDVADYAWGDSGMVSVKSVAGEARAAWVRSIPCFKDGTYYSKVVQAGQTTFRFLFLDNGFNAVMPGDNIEMPYVDKAQLHWLEDQLQQSDDDIEVVFMHIPLRSKGPGLEPSSELYRVLAKTPSVKLIVAGHNHQNAVTVFQAQGNHAITQVQTGAFARDNQNWRLIRLTNDQIIVSFPGKTEKELVINAN